MLFKPEVKFEISKQFDRQSMKYQMSKASCCKDIGIIKLEFEASVLCQVKALLGKFFDLVALL